ncbi:ABC transporter permease [Escherichia coli]|uniref:ABC transporter permease n=1 Tax=Escherichia coli TaxID=562 RepID=A0A377DT97_ECOLX|nr:ABC transporter permease [Escherichia coli]
MRIRYGWELALAALLVIEIVAFGAIKPANVRSQYVAVSAPVTLSALALSPYR